MVEDSNPILKNLIIEEIKKKGSISFRDFMEMALYYPQLGYYTSPGEKIGKAGDYYTSSHLTPIFGELIGKQILEMDGLLGNREFSIVEIGAGKGLFALDMLDFFKKEDTAFYGKLRYYIVEASPEFMKRQMVSLKDHPVYWHSDLNDLTPKVKGAFISNEVVDSFPVHQIVIEDSRLKEIFLVSPYP